MKFVDDTNERNQELKEYIEELCCAEDECLKNIKSHSREMGLPPIEVPSHVGKLIYLLAKIQRCQRILEIGTLGGYSTVWLARALQPGGKLISLEKDPIYVQVAQFHLHEAGVTDSVEIKEGDALETLPQLCSEQEKPFDLIFIDADKEHNQEYIEWALKLSRPGTLILIDNLIPKGNEVGVPSSYEASCIYRFNQYLANHPQLELTLLPSIVGNNGRLDCLGLIICK